VIGCACVLYLGAFAVGQVPLRAEPPASACTVTQKLPLFVGFADGMSLDSFEPATFAVREIWHNTQPWLCEDPALPHPTSAAHGARLRQALTNRHNLRLEAVQFDDPEWHRAHLVLRDLDTNKTAHSREHAEPRGWHIHVENTEDGWRVTHAADRRLPVDPAAPAPVVPAH
jgi:hypothetical protein